MSCNVHVHVYDIHAFNLNNKQFLFLSNGRKLIMGITLWLLIVYCKRNTFGCVFYLAILAESGFH